MKRVLLCLLLIFLCSISSRAGAEDSVFTSGAAIKNEISRIGDEGKLFVKGPVDPYLAETLGVAAVFGVTYAFDRDIQSSVKGAHNHVLTSLTDVGSTVGDPFVHLGVAAVVYTAGVVADAPRYMRLGEQMGEALVLADGASTVLKYAVGRGRPESGQNESRYRPFQFQSEYTSFPSMHTASSFALAHVFASKTDSLTAKILCYTAASFVGFSRIYQNKHWASDVIAGAAIGELAGNSVTRYYDLGKGKVTVAPIAVDGAPALALVGKF